MIVVSKDGVYRVIRILKEKNQSLCAIRKNIELEWGVVSYLLGHSKFKVDRTLINMWYNLYSGRSFMNLVTASHVLCLKHQEISRRIDENGSKILKLRGGKWSI